MSAFKTQVGGNHYKDLKIQPMQYSMANGLDACQHTIIKYVTRFREKGGLADLQKARHVIDMLIEHEYPNVKEQAQEEPKSEGEWIEWNGGECPVEEGVAVEVKLRDGDKPSALASDFRWNHAYGSKGYYLPYGDIIAYRVVK